MWETCKPSSVSSNGRAVKGILPPADTYFPDGNLYEITGLTRGVCELITTILSKTYMVLYSIQQGVQRQCSLLLLAIRWSKNAKKLSSNIAVSTCSEFERNEDYRINPPAKEILTYIWVKMKKLRRIRFKVNKMTCSNCMGRTRTPTLRP